MVEIFEGLFGAIFKFIGRIFVEFIFEILVKGLGYLICRPFNKNIDPDGLTVAIVGLLVWGCLVGGGIHFFSGT